MSRRGHHIITIGTSSGGLDALSRLAAQLPKALPATLFVVQHMAPDATASVLVESLKKSSGVYCTLARHEESFKQGHIYVAPPDYHMLVKKGKILVTKGARENRCRPGIDPLFRSAAVAYGAHVIGVLLTGRLDDGTVGLKAIKQCGGLAVVQEPSDPAYSDMPQSAINQVAVDYRVPLAEMGRLLERLVYQEVGQPVQVPSETALEAEIAERVLSDVRAVNRLGDMPLLPPRC
jgi:two-component system, chemotaxis family, protein-glutamate methylesterase/glutaminase